MSPQNMLRLGVTLKVFLGMAIPNQCYQAVVKEILG